MIDKSQLSVTINANWERIHSFNWHRKIFLPCVFCVYFHFASFIIHTTSQALKTDKTPNTKYTSKFIVYSSYNTAEALSEFSDEIRSLCTLLKCVFYIALLSYVLPHSQCYWSNILLRKLHYGTPCFILKQRYLQ